MLNPLGLWEIAILALLREEPMHPYQMQQLLRERHKDEILVLKRGSLYHAINRLLRAKLIAVVSSARHGRRPERTTYRICTAGRQQLVHSLRQMISVPRREPNDFLASMSFVIYITPAAAAAKLTERAHHLQQEILAGEAALQRVAARVPRIHLIESEYLLAMRRAELKWVRAVIGEIRSGRIAWDLQKIFAQLRAARKAASLHKETLRAKRGVKT